MAPTFASRVLLVAGVILTALLLVVPWVNHHAFDPVHVRNFQLSSTFDNDSTIVQNEDVYLLGLGRADITGPVVEINMMGYADTAQSGTGLRQRLYCRAFIVGHPQKPQDRIVYLVLDTQSGDTAVRHGILEGVEALGEEYMVYTEQNIAVTGTHSHSGPGAWLNYLLPQITSRGFDKASYQAIVNGSVLAIRRAHESLRPGKLSIGNGTTEGVSANRSPYAYLANPASERARYPTDTDVAMTVLNFVDTETGASRGILTWLPVHGTSLYQNNTLITGDNKGVAAYLFEESMKTESPGFVAGFSQANVGDTTPNVLGAFCEDNGLPCEFENSTCGGKTQGCHGRGPYFQYHDQGTRSCFEIGRRQSDAAHDILAQNMTPLGLSTVSSFHTFVDLAGYSFTSPLGDSRILQTCSAALGYSFAGGTSDGPGAFDFTQGTNDTDDNPSLKNPVWKLARRLVHQPTDEQVECQSPKPILLDVGESMKPYQWSPNIINIQTMRIGSLLIIIAPGEATTMSGRRWREAVAAHAEQILDIEEPTVVLGGPANTYAHYIATEEEYGVQRYEGASTLYGPHTLAAYVNLTLTYLPFLGPDPPTSPPVGPQPPINVNKSLDFITDVVYDNPPIFKSFGQALASPDPARIYNPDEIATARFVGANPRNNFRLEGTFAAVEILDDAGKWIQIRSDRDWHLVYHWKRTNSLTGSSEVTIDWEIDNDPLFDTQRSCRIRYYGDRKVPVSGRIEPFEGTSGIFSVRRASVKAADTELKGRVQ